MLLPPDFHCNKLTKKVLRIIVMCFGILITFAIPFSFFKPSFYFISGFLMIIASLIFITCFYSKIFFISKKTLHLKNVHVENAESDDISVKNTKQKLKFLSETKLAKHCFLLVLVLLACFLPGVITTAISVDSRLEAKTIFGSFPNWVLLLQLSNHSLNSIVLFWKRVDLRKGGKKVIRDIISA